MKDFSTDCNVCSFQRKSYGVATLNAKDPLVSQLGKVGINSCYKRKMFSS